MKDTKINSKITSENIEKLNSDKDFIVNEIVCSAEFSCKEPSDDADKNGSQKIK